MNQKITILDVKHALRDDRFRSSLPENLKEKSRQWLKDPSCTCHLPFYRDILKKCRKQLTDYFPGREPEDPDEEIVKNSKNNWKVINCSIYKLEDELKRLGPGRKQVAITRYEDQITLVVNELDIIF